MIKEKLKIIVIHPPTKAWHKREFSEEKGHFVGCKTYTIESNKWQKLTVIERRCKK